MDWLRWHRGSATDPRLRVVSRRSGQPIPLVLAVLAFLKEAASEGETRGIVDAGRWSDEDVGAAMDVDASEVLAVREAMEGKYLEGWRLLDWERENPKRERDSDLSTDRVRAFRERSKATTGDAENETPRNATKRHRTPRADKIRVEENREEILPPMGEEKNPPEGTPAAPGSEDEAGKKAQQLVKWYIDQQPSRPSQSAIGKQSGIALRICESRSSDDVRKAIKGMRRLFPFSNGAPWDLGKLEARFDEALKAEHDGYSPNGNGKHAEPVYVYEPGPDRF